MKCSDQKTAQKREDQIGKFWMKGVGREREVEWFLKEKGKMWEKKCVEGNVKLLVKNSLDYR